MKKLLLTSLFIAWTLALSPWTFAEGAQAAFTDHTLGDADAPVHWEIFDDFECPFCQRLHNSIQDPRIQNFIKDGTVKITIKDYPLSFHSNALNAAKAANAVGDIAPDKYYDMVDMIFDNQYGWGSNSFETFSGYAKELGINTDTFKKSFEAPANQAEIDADIAEATRRGVSGTPNSFINGTALAGAQPADVFIAAIEKAAGLDIRPVPSNNIYQDFDIISADFNAVTSTIGIYWEESNFLNDAVLINTFVIKYDINDPNTGKLEDSFKREIRDVFSGEYFIPAKPNKKYSITMEAYAADGVYMGADKITLVSIPTQKNTPPANFEDDIITNPLSNPFSDTDLNTAAGEAAKELYKLAIIGGFPDGSFRENQAVNRAEAAKFLLLASDQNPGNDVLANNFLDVIASEWYGPYVLKAASLKIIEGFTDRSFRPGAKIQRDQFLAMIARTFKLQTGLSHDFADKNINPDAWYWDYAGIASKYDLFPGETSLRPEQTMTRGEVAIAIHQYLKNR